MSLHQDVCLVLKNKLKPKLHDRADIGLKMRARVAFIEWWIPDLNREDVMAQKISRGY